MENYIFLSLEIFLLTLIIDGKNISLDIFWTKLDYILSHTWVWNHNFQNLNTVFLHDYYTEINLFYKHLDIYSFSH